MRIATTTTTKHHAYPNRIITWRTSWELIDYESINIYPHFFPDLLSFFSMTKNFYNLYVYRFEYIFFSKRLKSNICIIFISFHICLSFAIICQNSVCFFFSIAISRFYMESKKQHKRTNIVSFLIIDYECLDHGSWSFSSY